MSKQEKDPKPKPSAPEATHNRMRDSKDPRMDLMMSVHNEIAGQPLKQQKLLFPSWIRRTTNYLQQIEQTQEIPKAMKECLENAKSVVEGTNGETVNPNPNQNQSGNLSLE